MMDYTLQQSVNVKTFKTLVPDLAALELSGIAAQFSRWCVWQAKDRHGQKPAKIPMSGTRPLSVDKPETWLSFGAAAQGYHGGGSDGVGALMGSATGPIVGLDLDACLDPETGEPLPDRGEIVAQFVALGGYVERSPSATGLRQFLHGSRPANVKQKSTRSGLEVYDNGDARYLTLTGIPFGETLGTLIENQPGLEAFLSAWADLAESANPAPAKPARECLDDERTADEVLALLRQRNKRGRITRLLAGNFEDYPGHSEADMALCCEIAYYSRDPDVIDEIFRGSGLMRSKWDEKRGKETYGSRTIDRALELQEANFDDELEAVAEQAESAAAAAHAREQFLIGGASDLKRKGRYRTDVWALAELLVRDRRLVGAIFFDEFAGFATLTRSLREVFEDRSAPASIGRVHDDHIRALVRWFGRVWGIGLRLDVAQQAMFAWAQQVRLNPVTERLDDLADRWDNKPRLDNWLIDYCRAKSKSDDGADLTEYLKAIGARWLIGAVARAYQPGCKMDCMLVLEGRQGARKSSAARALGEAIGPETFREGFHLGGSKDDLLALRGRLIVEWGELSGLGKRDRNELKVFLTQQTDAYRDPYGMTERDWPRTAVFVGSTNDSHYLADSTGGRRFWPVTVGLILIDKLRRDAGQLWGEAVHRYRAGARWWLDDQDPREQKLLDLATGEQAARIGAGLWEDIGAELAERLAHGEMHEPESKGGYRAAAADGAFSVAQMRVWVAVLAQCGDKDFTAAEWNQVTEGLKRSGWQSRKSRGRMVWELTPERRDTLFYPNATDRVGIRV